MSEKDQALAVEIVGGRLVVSIGVSALAFAVLQGDWAREHYDEKSGEFLTPTVTDEAAFAKAIAHELAGEDEDGDSALHRCLDKAALSAVESGCDGIRMPGDAL